MSRCKACDRILLSTSLKSNRKTKEGHPDFEDLCSYCKGQIFIHTNAPTRDFVQGYVDNPVAVLLESGSIQVGS